MPRLRFSLYVLALLLAGGCSSSDSKPADSGPPPDTATPDTATPDTATPDTATPDTATPDAEISDATATDATGDTAATDATGDATATDTTATDATATDAAATDAAPTDTTTTDGAQDSSPPSDLGSLGDLFPPPPDGAPKADGPQYGCGQVGFEGCCRGSVLYYCDASGLLLVVDCASAAQCGWSEFYKLYDCGTDGKADPTGTHAKACPF